MEAEIKGASNWRRSVVCQAAIAQRIRNPLASVSGSIQLLRAELALDESNQRLMDIIAHEIARLNTIITDFLAYARPLRCSMTRLTFIN